MVRLQMLAPIAIYQDNCVGTEVRLPRESCDNLCSDMSDGEASSGETKEHGSVYRVALVRVSSSPHFNLICTWALLLVVTAGISWFAYRGWLDPYLEHIFPELLVLTLTWFCCFLISRGKNGARHSNGAEEITTMMIRKMPCRLKQSDIVSELDACGFVGTYDWLYMPSNLAVERNSKAHGKGYAFVNFIKPEFATRLKEEWHRSRHFKGRKSVLDISVAAVQGKEKNIEQFKRGKTSQIRSSSFRPVEPESLLIPTLTVEKAIQSAALM